MEQELQKTKLERYDELLQKFVEWLGSDKRQEKKSAREFIMAYCRATSYASREVMTAIGEYIFYRQGGKLPLDHVGVSADELRAMAKKARGETEGWVSASDKVFMAIREDIFPRKPLPFFHTPIRPSQLDKYER